MKVIPTRLFGTVVEDFTYIEGPTAKFPFRFYCRIGKAGLVVKGWLVLILMNVWLKT